MSETVEDQRYIPTDEEEAQAQAIDRRVIEMRSLATLMTTALHNLSDGIVILAQLNADLAAGRLALTGDRETRQTIAWAAALVEDLGGETIANLTGGASSAEMMARSFERIAVLIRENGRCEHCGNYHEGGHAQHNSPWDGAPLN